MARPKKQSLQDLPAPEIPNIGITKEVADKALTNDIPAIIAKEIEVKEPETLKQSNNPEIPYYSKPIGTYCTCGTEVEKNSVTGLTMCVDCFDKEYGI